MELDKGQRDWIQLELLGLLHRAMGSDSPDYNLAATVPENWDNEIDRLLKGVVFHKHTYQKGGK